MKFHSIYNWPVWFTTVNPRSRAVYGELYYFNFALLPRYEAEVIANSLGWEYVTNA